MIVSEVIVKILEKEGITDAFGIPGAGINPVYKYLDKSKQISHCLVRHEEAAVHCADGYYRASGKIALAICTSGPGATNFVTGLYTAWIDSIPLIAITGQNNSFMMGTGAFQCVDIAEISKSVVKKAFCILDETNIVETLKEAFWCAREGRPGPVLIDLPLDIQQKNIDFSIDLYTSKEIVNKSPDQKSIDEVIKLLDTSKKPIVIFGGGVVLSGAEQQLVEFAEYMSLPVCTTYMAKGGIPDAHPLFAGQIGIQVGASSIGNELFLDSDVVVGIGCRFTDRHTGNLDIYKGNRKFIHIDIDPNEVGKLIEPEIGIICDAGLALESLIQTAKRTGAKRIGAPRIKDLKSKLAKIEHSVNELEERIDPRAVFSMINTVFDDDTLFTTGCGLNQIWSGQYQKINKPRKYLASGGAGTLGFDIPCAIGASIAADNEKAVCIMGDFGFTFLIEELAVAVKQNLPIVVIILNNSYLSLIRQNQKYAYDYTYQVEMIENKEFVDYVKISEGFGCQAVRVKTYEKLQEALNRAKEIKTPFVIDVFVDEDVDCNMGNSISAIKIFD